MRIIKFSAKCSDLFGANLIVDGKLIGDGYDGYVPKFFPGVHYGDYVIMEVDIDTGKILNWKTPTATQLADTFEKQNYE